MAGCGEVEAPIGSEVKNTGSNNGDRVAGRGVVLVISGPSGVGKSTVVKHLLEDEYYVLSISGTTRARRPEEADGREYYFLGREEFERWVRDGRFIEHVELFGNYYGTPREPLEQAVRQGKVYVLDIDVQGAIRLRDGEVKGIYILLSPPGMEVLKQRLRGRGTESEEQLAQRTDHACWELQQEKYYDHVVVNDDLDRAIGEIRAFVDSHLRR